MLLGGLPCLRKTRSYNAPRTASHELAWPNISVLSCYSYGLYKSPSLSNRSRTALLSVRTLLSSLSLSHKHQRLLPETSISLRPFGLRLWYHQIQHPLSVAYIMGCVYHITSPPRNNVVDLDFAHAEHYTLAYVANKFPGNDHSLLAAASKPVIPSP